MQIRYQFDTFNNLILLVIEYNFYKIVIIQLSFLLEAKTKTKNTDQIKTPNVIQGILNYEI